MEVITASRRRMLMPLPPLPSCSVAVGIGATRLFSFDLPLIPFLVLVVLSFAFRAFEVLSERPTLAFFIPADHLGAALCPLRFSVLLLLSCPGGFA